MRKPSSIPKPDVLARLVIHFGSAKRATAALGVRANWATQWKRNGLIPEIWALDIEALNVADAWGHISVYDVLYEAAAARRERILRQREEDLAEAKEKDQSVSKTPLPPAP